MGDVSPQSYFDRQMRVSGWGAVGQKRLTHARVLVVGLGGLGCPVASALARAGVGGLILADADRVEASNLPRQTLFTLAECGELKVEAARRALVQANPWINIETTGRVDSFQVRQLIEKADLVIEGSDNLETKFLVHDACRAGGKPLVLGALYQWECLTTTFRFDRSPSPCWRCLYPEQPPDGCVGVCSEVGVAGALAGVAGNLMALVATRLLLGHETVEGTIVFDATDGTTRTLKWHQRPDCSCAQALGDWSWLETYQNSRAQKKLSVSWDALAPSQRAVVVDLREQEEIRDGEWAWFEKHGSVVIHRPWSQWALASQVWNPEISYLLVCAKGFRSEKALQTLPPGLRAYSLSGGLKGLAVYSV
ncbi:MAG: hypothetical protein HKM05_03260 [Spirochaetales bacterium]|nr:hypothetical protein [Spirochaetales bacterium]